MMSRTAGKAVSGRSEKVARSRPRSHRQVNKITRDDMTRQRVKFDRSSKKHHGRGGFQIEILFPGLAAGSREDSGIGTIGRIDHARVQPGTLIPMHPHRDDEILTYLRSGRVRHSDTVGKAEEISPAR